ncbi:MAG: hypothetical protein GIW94_00655 [Candidatus Eremiobacteraeota bacterium]|nr:hypothetical protein [Candidatus Eremiobacteraeota bacterium]MBC5821140.1 hypothetical protein [Candidatus Eremiobacteraeota bacterium]
MKSSGRAHARWWCVLSVGALLTSLSGCHIHNTMPPGPPPSGLTFSPPTGPTGALPLTEASTTFNVAGGGATVPLSSLGLGGTLQYAGNNVFSAAGTFTLTTLTPTSGPGANVPSALVYFQVQLNSTVTFNAPFTISPVVFPASFSTNGITFTETLYNQNNGAPIGSPVQGVVNGQSVSFAPPGNGSFTATGNVVYLAVVSGS